MGGGDWIKAGARRWVSKRFQHWHGQVSVARSGIMSPVSMPPVGAGVTDAAVDESLSVVPRPRAASVQDAEAAVAAAVESWVPCELNDLDPRALSFVLTIVERLEVEGYHDYALAVLGEIDVRRLSPGHRLAVEQIRVARAVDEPRRTTRTRPRTRPGTEPKSGPDGVSEPSLVAPTRAR